MRISIITTIYKAELDLPRLLESMIAQKSPNLEFFLIDNGSPDRCGEICAEYAKRDSRIVVYTIKDNVGYIKARNIGIEQCSGDFVGFCDSDDYLEPAGYDRAISKIAEFDSDLYITSWRTHYSQKEVVFAPPFETGLYEGVQVERDILPNAFGPTRKGGILHGFAWKQICRKNILLDYGIRFNTSLKPYEDQLFNVDLIRRCRRVYVDNNVIYNYIASTSSITGQLQQSKNYDQVWNLIIDLYREKIKRAAINDYVIAAANASFNLVVSLIWQMSKDRSVTARQNVRIFRGFVDEAILDGIICQTDRTNSFLLNIMRLCLKYRLYRVIFVLMKFRAFCIK